MGTCAFMRDVTAWVAGELLRSEASVISRKSHHLLCSAPRLQYWVASLDWPPLLRILRGPAL